MTTWATILVAICLNAPTIFALATPAAALASPKTIIVHMANTPNVVRWALNEGANGVELDLHFSGNHPSVFKHSTGALEPCDCSCICALGFLCTRQSVCNALWRDTGSHCRASSTAQDMTMTLGDSDIRSRLAVIYIDSKLDDSVPDLYAAGHNLVQLLNKNTFGRGYLGQVIVSAGEIKYATYLRGALKAATDSPYASQYFYTFDAEHRDHGKVWTELRGLGTNQIVYSTGFTICSWAQYFNEVSFTASQNVYAGVAIWTLDSESSMKKYIEEGANLILTNKPTVALQAVGGAGNLASPGQALVAKPTEPLQL